MSTQPSVAFSLFGAAYEYAEKNLGGPVAENVKTVSVATTVTQLVPNNPDRLVLVIVNLGSGTVYAAPDPSVSTIKGVSLANGSSLSVVLPFDFTLCSREWDAIADASGPYNVFVIELYRISKVVT